MRYGPPRNTHYNSPCFAGHFSRLSRPIRLRFRTFRAFRAAADKPSYVGTVGAVASRGNGLLSVDALLSDDPTDGFLFDLQAISIISVYATPKRFHFRNGCGGNCRTRGNCSLISYFISGHFSRISRNWPRKGGAAGGQEFQEARRLHTLRLLLGR